MKIKYILIVLQISLLFLSSCNNKNNESDCRAITMVEVDSSDFRWLDKELETKDVAIVFLDIDYYGEVPVYNTSRGGVLKKVKNDSIQYDCVIFELIDKKDSMFYVAAISSMTGRIIAKGWINRDSHLHIYNSMYQGNLVVYKQPDTSKVLYVEKEYNPESYPVVDFSGSWLKIKVKKGNSYIEGWIPRREQCPNVYSTCS